MTSVKSIFRNSIFWRFCLVGVVNTLVDITLFTILHLSGVPLVVANICSTSVALSMSLLLNYRFTFKGRELTRFKIFTYIIVTLAGLWGLQPIIINKLMAINRNFNFIGPFVKIFSHPAVLDNVIPKMGSICVTLVWNYLWYSIYIFKSVAPKVRAELTMLDL